MTTSLMRLRTRMRRAPFGARLLAALLVLSLGFALTPCCEIFAAPAMAAAHAPEGHGSGDCTCCGLSAAGRSDPCAAWLERSAAVPAAKAGVMGQAPEKSVAPVLHAVLPPAVPPVVVRRSFHQSASLPSALYLRHARLIL